MLRKLALAGATALAGLAVVAPTASATTLDTCFDAAPGAACTAQTVESRVDVAQVRLGRHSYGFYFLTCARHDDVVTRAGRIGVGGQRTVTMDRLGLDNPTCVLSAVAIADSFTHNARATVTLFD